MLRIFISYRRADSITVTGRIYDNLVEAFGEENVFQDVETLHSGVDFRSDIKRAVNKTDVMLIIIGAQWANIRKGWFGRKRLFDPEDLVRIEAETAIELGRLVVPVLVNGATMPLAHQLPEKIKLLAYSNAAVIRENPDFHKDMERLVGHLKRWQVERSQSETVPSFEAIRPDEKTGPMPPLHKPSPKVYSTRSIVISSLILLIIGSIFIASILLRRLPGATSTLTPTTTDRPLLGNLSSDVPSVVPLSQTLTSTATATPSQTPRPAATNSSVPTTTTVPTRTQLPTATATPVPSATPTRQPSATATNTGTPTFTPTITTIPSTTPAPTIFASETVVSPQPPVELTASRLVTNAEYKANCYKNGNGSCSIPLDADRFRNISFDNQPVLGITWRDAQKYCVTIGTRLLTHSEWDELVLAGTIQSEVYQEWVIGNNIPLNTIDDLTKIENISRESMMMPVVKFNASSFDFPAGNTMLDIGFRCVSSLP